MGISNLPTYVSLQQAAKQYRVSVEALRAAVENDMIRAAKTPGGGILVASEDVSLVAIQANPDLKGNPIRVTEAAAKYSVSQSSLTRWSEAGYIQIIERGPKLLMLDEADVKLAVEIFNRARKETGSSVRAGWVLKRTLAQLQAT